MAEVVRWKYIEDTTGTRFPISEALASHAALADSEFKQKILNECGIAPAQNTEAPEPESAEGSHE